MGGAGAGRQRLQLVVDGAVAGHQRRLLTLLLPPARPAEGSAGGAGALHAVPPPLGGLLHLRKLLLLLHAQISVLRPGALLLQVPQPLLNVRVKVGVIVFSLAHVEHI